MGSRPAGFVLDAKSMGLNPSRPPSRSRSPSPSPSASQKCRQVQVQPTETSASRLHEQSSVEASSHVQCTASTETMSTDHYRDLLQKLREANGDAGDMNFELNNIFLKRLDDIDCLDEHEGDDMDTLQLRLNTFQEWVDFLLHVNSMILGNVSDLEKETYSKIVACTQSVQGQQQQTLEENRRLRKDICAIIKHVQSSPHCKTIDFHGVSLETLTVNQVQGIGKDHARPECEGEKMAESMKSLVSEIAAKHDEICNLKSQIKDLDDFVQTARQKLLLKDQCIAQLNQQLQEITQCMEIMSEAEDKKRNQEHLEDSLIGDAITNDMLENLSIHDNQESEKLRLLNAELNELFDLYAKKDYQAIESRKKRLSCFFGELASERDDTVKKLETIRSQLRILQSDLDHSCLNSIGYETEHCELDADGQMLEALRRRLLTLNQVNRELHGKYQRLDTESKKLQARIESENGFNQRNSDVLREIADLICKLGSMEFSYNEIYDESSKENPFCTTIAELFELRYQQGQKQMENECDTKTPSQTRKPPKSTKIPGATAQTKPTTKPSNKPTTTKTITTKTTKTSRTSK